MASLQNVHDKLMKEQELDPEGFKISDYHNSVKDEWSDPMFNIYHNPNEYTIKSKYSFKEDVVLKELSKYIDTTYSSHYTNTNNDIQSLDVWQARGTMSDSCIDTTIKYLMRYGKKSGKNRKDLLKAAHYIVLALGNE